MLENTLKSALFTLLAGALLAGCGSTRDVEVAGTVTAPIGAKVSGDIRVEFIDTSITDDPEAALVRTIALSKPGAFSETMPLSGDSVLIRALNDTNGDAQCSTGEAWAEFEAKISSDGKVEPVAIELENRACP